MSAQGMLRIVEGGYAAYCPGCKCHHLFDRHWKFDGNFEKPTFSPSMLVDANYPDSRCHSFVRNGNWEFLLDCAHELAGRTVPMEVEDE